MAEETPFSKSKKASTDLNDIIKSLENQLRKEIKESGESDKDFQLTQIQFRHNPDCWLIQRPNGSWYWLCTG